MLTPFLPAEFPPETFSVDHWVAQGLSEDEAHATIEKFAHQRSFINNVYQVDIRDLAGHLPENFPAMWCLSIKRRDRRVVRDWRDLQFIKNALVGEEHEGCELFPAESRLVDTANQYYMFVFKEAGTQFPFGFFERAVTEAPKVAGSKQRPFRKGGR